ncbi:MAG TPA: DUF2107 domain-containing protein [Methanothermococcus okinawensis]|uniref:DUF2107 domain-containing protein n=1 Tax=Methanothermococcus okinawensis TaxID=155863 RepID=A0A832ZKA6_9EURY|nr:DUF2107 domain-containing protein [Methanococcaceae archaeon]HIP84218.1 DUF2107 domain-containing protein [Methanothermococcus okinawensis]HIP91016.1 DUF2107 domain-containing protein [Methanothermococcus okinawensis]
MDIVISTLYLGYILLIFGTLGVILGPERRDPFVRLLNIEIPALGVMLIFLAYNHTLALMTYIAINSLIVLVFIRTIIRKEELEA